MQRTALAAAGMADRFQARMPDEPPMHDMGDAAQSGMATAAQTGSRYALGFVATAAQLSEVQHLRYKVFAEEMGASLADSPGLQAVARRLDADEFDSMCEHLLVRERLTDRVVGIYRLLPPEQARRLGKWYSQSEFDLTALAPLLPTTVEAGRSCVHWEHRNGTVIMLLWSGIAAYMRRYGYHYLIGCASVSLRDGGDAALATHRLVSAKHWSPPQCRVLPHLPYPLDRATDDAGTIRGKVALPPLLKGYLRAGAQVCGAPAWDPDFNTADCFVMLATERMSARYADRFAM